MERRISIDRRRRPTTLWSSLRPGGRRRAFRRVDDAGEAYADHSSSFTVSLVFYILGASVLDAVFTLLHVRTGAREANPLMNAALEHGVEYFLASKIAVTALGCCFLAMHERFALSASGLRIVAVTYLVLLAYHAAIFLVR